MTGDQPRRRPVSRIRKAPVITRHDGNIAEATTSLVIHGGPEPTLVEDLFAGEHPGLLAVGVGSRSEDIPVTTTGKLLRHKLSQAFAERLADVRQRRSPADIEPSGSVYESVARVWEEILEQPVSEQTDFLSAGGDSLSMIRCLAELNELFDTAIPIDTFLNNPELGDFVTGLERVLREGVGQVTTPQDLDETTTNDIGDRIENHN